MIDLQHANILLLENIHPNVFDAFKHAGFENIRCLSKPFDNKQHSKYLPMVNILGIRSQSQLTAEAIAKMPNLKAIGCFCIGTNQVDLRYAFKHIIPVFNAPYSNTRSVAELALAAIIFLLRGIAEKNSQCHLGKWQKSAAFSYEVRKKKLGIVGYGNIGSQLGNLAAAIGMEVYYYDPKNTLSHGNAIPTRSLSELLKISDILTLHVPESPSTHNMMSTQQFKLMKEGSYIINYSRGKVIDIDALCNALDTQKIRGAALDVFPNEPTNNDLEFISPLCQYPQVILTPHIGGSTQEAQANIGLEVSQKLIEYIKSGNTTGTVNFPEITLEGSEKIRISHTHQNFPGMLGQINNILAEHGINVVRQSLQTKEDIGYTLFDIEHELSSQCLQALKNIKGTLRCFTFGSTL